MSERARPHARAGTHTLSALATPGVLSALARNSHKATTMRIVKPALAAASLLLLLAAGCSGGSPGGGGDDMPDIDGGPDEIDGGPGSDGGPGIDASVDAAIDAGPVIPPPQNLTVCGTGAADHATIGAAIAAATPGSTLRVCGGTYDERLVIDGKPLILIGTDGAAATILDGADTGTLLTVRQTSGEGVKVSGFTFRAGRSMTEGGAVRCETSKLEMVDSVIINSRAPWGGGLYATGCELTLRANRIEGNFATENGGGLMLRGSSGTVESNRILTNNALQNGGGVASEQGMVALVGNEILTNSAFRGAGLHHTSDARIAMNVIADNRAGWTGGGLHLVGHAPTIATNVIRGNSSMNDGGGFYLHQSNAQIIGNQVVENTTADDGGGIRVFESMAVLTDNIVERNHASDAGGGIRVSHIPSTLINNTVRDNIAGGTGGGMDLDNDSSLVRGGVISGNRAGGSGGGIFHWLGIWDGMRLEDVLITGNRAWQGGGLYLQDNFRTVQIRRVKFIGNRAAKGAGIMVSATDFTVTGSLFTDNIASERGGAILAVANERWMGLDGVSGACPCPPVAPFGQVHFNVMTRNTAPRGAAIWTSFPGLEIANSILAGHAGVAIEAAADENAPPGDPEQGIPEPALAVPSVVYSDIYPAVFAGMMDPTTTGGNMSVEPGFVNAVANDFHLAPGSPLIDAGSPTLVDADGSRADMGMYGGAP